MVSIFCSYQASVAIKSKIQNMVKSKHKLKLVIGTYRHELASRYVKLSMHTLYNDTTITTRFFIKKKKNRNKIRLKLHNL
ncbi:hypothetical protein EUGRSUZ_F01896 [Eucalyptus grandis]|uniref:Uncharacterized protein n=2 Tax=Eucalyptus grandis TaxID=71139 RepID=A0ACC3KG75_EUCGR|nr:hypothetical protein EUGRSUZ_F01896 [Eucalyptus grandis]